MAARVAGQGCLAEMAAHLRATLKLVELGSVEEKDDDVTQRSRSMRRAATRRSALARQR